MSYCLRKYIAGGARFLEYVVENGERALRGLLPGKVRRTLQTEPLHAEAQLAIQEQIGQGVDAQAGFESVDMIVWNNKRYREQPLLCDGDGEILKWRRYFSPFYVK